MTSPFTNPMGRAPAAAAAYVRSILELLGDRDPLQVLAQLPAALRGATGGVDESLLRLPEAPGKWSMHQVVAHLADSEVVFGWRLRLVLAQDNPVITGYDQDAWIAKFADAYPSTRFAIELIAQLRAAHLALLLSLKDADWDRVGMHAERGPESVRLMAQLYAGHDLVHLRQLARIREGM